MRLRDIVNNILNMDEQTYEAFMDRMFRRREEDIRRSLEKKERKTTEKKPREKKQNGMISVTSTQLEALRKLGLV